MKILVIEDDPAIRQTLAEILELNGHDVLAVSSGEEGVERADPPPDLIFCDVGLPGIDGYQVIKRIQEKPGGRDIPFIFLTARAERNDLRKGMNLGADDYITKPFTERDILDAIKARSQKQNSIRQKIERLIDEQQRTYSADWSHELMTPLAGVMGGLDLIESETESITPSELKDLLKLIREGAERQRRLSQKLILYFELQKQVAQKTANFETCQAASAVRIGALQAAEDAGRRLDLIIACDDCIVPLSESRLTYAILELTGNAFRFSSRGQSVAIQGLKSGSLYTISIEDQGPGMTSEQRAFIGPFTQFERRRKEQQGLGLGLAIASLTATLAGGHLTLEEGSQGRGLRALIHIPATTLLAQETSGTADSGKLPGTMDPA